MYIIISYYIFNSHFFYIQEACIKNQLDFFDLCRTVHFRWDLISTGITISYSESEELKRQQKFYQEQQRISENTEPEKSFPKFLIHEKPDQLASDLGNEFNSEKGKSIRILLEVLKQKNILHINYRENTILHKAMKAWFKQNIGTKQSIFNYNFSSTANKTELENVEKRVDIIFEKLGNK